MYQSATKQKTEDLFLKAVGNVSAITSEGFWVRSSAGVFPARPALSCLIKPEIGDKVLVAGDAQDAFFILAVLERPGGSSVHIPLDGDVMIGVSGGRFSVAATDGVHVVTPREMTLNAQDLNITASKANVLFEQISYMGHVVWAEIGKIKWIGKYFHAFIDSVSQRVKRSYRVIEEVDSVQSRQIDYKAKETMNLQGRHALIKANELVKIDGDQIHLG